MLRPAMIDKMLRAVCVAFESRKRAVALVVLACLLAAASIVYNVTHSNVPRVSNVSGFPPK
jgi:hypothetical protein